jgi:hypothetical protein
MRSVNVAAARVDLCNVGALRRPVASARKPRYYARRMQDYSAVVEKLRGKRVLVVGDVMLDEYLRGDVARVSPEARF